MADKEQQEAIKELSRDEVAAQAIWDSWVTTQERISREVKEKDQTTKQPVVWRCQNPVCLPTPEEIAEIINSKAGINEPIKTAGGLIYRPSLRSFDFESQYPTCPKCSYTGPPVVNKRSLIHVLLQDRNGPIVGEKGLRWFIACDPKRRTLATTTNGEACTGNSSQANCPGCLKRIGNKLIISGYAAKIDL